MQQHLELIPHQTAGGLVCQRPSDGYINATAMCQATGKRWNHYASNEGTKAFIAALAADTGIPAAVLVQSLSGGTPELQGTWVHPQVAINLATWCSPIFAVQVSKWVHDWMRGHSAVRPALPYHLRRHLANHPNVPAGHFSILVEMTILLIAPMEDMGYTLPEHLLPDISQGLMFCKWLREEWGIDTDALPKYRHDFEDGRVVWPKAYPDDMLAEFRRHFWTAWLPLKSEAYFAGRDSRALEYLPRLLAKAAAAGLHAPAKRLPPRPIPKKMRQA
ncbi:KilA-N domain-containing protein [Methylobacterium sp. NMS14P]|uniref:KilA-N domain-containing protein n=1 Tax=Methylobacterium sp. NMS14P TaxID=2894310 RepID=UPI002358C5E1|nr:KilA-N domain-containing protein [Methylobacterium sp. NMS14P]WCS27202.1 KilA-N domain-containing protein [Methylobacterium sp. NMS14P]